MNRTHNCGELRKQDVNKKVTLCGWVHSRRDHGGVIFVDLRDRFGITQIVFNPDCKYFSDAEKLRREFCIEVSGIVKTRKKNMENPNLATGEIEVLIDDLTVLNSSEVPPLEVDDRIIASDDIRLKYRYLDLRRPVMQRNLALRHKAAQAAREYFNNHGFLEIETPFLVRSTPEGARDYVVPSRVSPGKIYALPQSPQLYKQTLMISGFDRYYQIARCLRDEDLRADRQPEHTQLDFEMSFVTAKDIMEFVEGLLKHILKKTIGVDIKDKFPVYTYKEAMERFGTDKPDIRFSLELIDIGEIAKQSDFAVFKSAIDAGGRVKCINAKNCANFSRKDIEELTELVGIYKAKGLAWMKITENGLESSIVKFFSKKVQKQLIKLTNAEKGDLLLFVADKEKIVHTALGELRNELAKRLKLVNPKEFKFCWVTDYPLFAWNEDEQRWEPEHHMFSMPKKEHFKYLETDPGKVQGDLFDVVLNGIELGSGSIRITQPELQRRVMNVIGMTDEEANKKFGFLLNAYRYGGPPHGGMGLGFDRLLALMIGTNDIREVIAFPKNKAAECPMDGSPSEWDPHQLRELRLRLDIIKKRS
ncbi:aspartate--tRNA ligase [Candidatus Woesearchaeota archaeon]|nr:MAG: aspartate--tRNA ligase [Candidatus Woesearchaeota archaeon]